MNIKSLLTFFFLTDSSVTVVYSCEGKGEAVLTYKTRKTSKQDKVHYLRRRKPKGSKALRRCLYGRIRYRDGQTFVVETVPGGDVVLTQIGNHFLLYYQRTIITNYEYIQERVCPPKDRLGMFTIWIIWIFFVSKILVRDPLDLNLLKALRRSR